MPQHMQNFQNSGSIRGYKDQTTDSKMPVPDQPPANGGLLAPAPNQYLLTEPNSPLNNQPADADLPKLELPIRENPATQKTVEPEESTTTQQDSTLKKQQTDTDLLKWPPQTKENPATQNTVGTKSVSPVEKHETSTATLGSMIWLIIGAIAVAAIGGFIFHKYTKSSSSSRKQSNVSKFGSNDRKMLELAKAIAEVYEKT